MFKWICWLVWTGKICGKRFSFEKSSIKGQPRRCLKCLLHTWKIVNRVIFFYKYSIRGNRKISTQFCHPDVHLNETGKFVKMLTRNLPRAMQRMKFRVMHRMTQLSSLAMSPEPYHRILLLMSTRRKSFQYPSKHVVYACDNLPS